MLKRLLVGLIKGFAVGGIVGAIVHFVLRWTTTSGLLTYLLAMGVGATAGLLTGKPPWRQEAWIEGLLKGLVGIGVGAVVFWLGSRFLPLAVPWSVAGTPRDTVWTSLPLFYAPAIAALYGAIVELDNTEPRRRSRLRRREEQW